MTDRKTTLVLGAGASLAYGYPLGGQLRRDLLLLEPGTGPAGKVLNEVRNELIEFQSAFSLSQMASIDAFLARRPEYAEIGKIAIASTLLSRESWMALTRNEDADNWYYYLFNRIAEATRWEELDLSWLKVVTFNYDRSFEHYMLSALRHAYGKTQDEALKKLLALDVIHVYGSLGPTTPDQDGYFGYSNEVSSRRVSSAAESIRVIPEGRSEDSTIQRAREAILSADALCFLGFGYDSINLGRIAAHETCRQRIGIDGDARFRDVAYTCMGMTVEEAKRVYFTFNGGFVHMPNSQYPPDFYPMNCISTLRSTQILQPPWQPPW